MPLPGVFSPRLHPPPPLPSLTLLLSSKDLSSALDPAGRKGTCPHGPDPSLIPHCFSHDQNKSLPLLSSLHIHPWMTIERSVSQSKTLSLKKSVFTIRSTSSCCVSPGEDRQRVGGRFHGGFRYCSAVLDKSGRW